MTKKIRIENADTSDWKIEVEVWDEIDNTGPTLTARHDLHYPTQMLDINIWQNRFLVVREIKLLPK